MNAKFVFAVFLALQVSLTLCELPVPDKELVDKYEGLKATFYSRIRNAIEKLKTAAEPLVEKASAHERAQVAKEAFEGHLQGNLPVAQQLAQAIGEEMTPAIDRARSAVLGVYGQYLRPYIGDYLNDAINRIKPVLDEVLPAEN